MTSSRGDEVVPLTSKSGGGSGGGVDDETGFGMAASLLPTSPESGLAAYDGCEDMNRSRTEWIWVASSLYDCDRVRSSQYIIAEV